MKTQKEIPWRHHLPPTYRQIDPEILEELLALAEEEGLSLIRAARWAFKRQPQPKDPSAFLSWALTTGYKPARRQAPLAS